MKVNLMVRLKNKSFWISIIPAALLAIQVIAKVFGYEIDFGELGNNAVNAVNAVFVVLTLCGVVNDPTSKGYSDSDRALQYEVPTRSVKEL